MNYDYKEIVPYLLNWYDYNARILVWRDNPTPYNVWISEIMLQQTRVEAVKGYFDRFTQALPDIRSLAEAQDEMLLKLWEGLGYYNRVRNLKKTAQVIINEYGGEFPADYDELLKLPGIGSYTAGAISSIAFQIPVPAVDGNVLRVTKRIAGSFDDITKERIKKELWMDLRQITPRERPGDFNQSLMELGAILCLPNGKPLCDKCPVMHLCNAFHKGITMDIPVKPAKKERRKENRTILLMEFQDKYAIRKRQDKGLLAGLWEFPNLVGTLSQKEVQEALEKEGFVINKLEPIGKAKHIFTHIEWNMIGYKIRIEDTADLSGEQGLLWADKDEIKNIYALPNAFSAFTAHLLNHNS